jgi:nitroreductase
MEIIEAIHNRRSIRGYKSDPVPKTVLKELLEACLWAPSSRNQQSWETAVLGGQTMERAKTLLSEKIRTEASENADLPPAELTGPYLRRATELRDSIDTHQFPPGTDNLEEKRAQYWLRGGTFWDAPNAIILYTEKALGPKAIFDGGIMAQTIALAALHYGLGTCILIRPVNWPDMLRELLGISESKLILVAIAIGYPDPEVLANTYERHRDPLNDFVHWHGLD